VQQAAAKNNELSDALQTVASALKQVSTQKDALAKDLERIEAGINSTRQKLELAGLSQALGLLLHKQRRSLPDVRLLEKKMADNQRMIVETGLVQLRVLEGQKQLDAPDGYIAQLTVGLNPDELVGVEPELRKIFASRKALLDKLYVSNQIYLGTLSEIEILYNQLVNAVTSFQGLMAERLLWIRSMPLFHLQELGNLHQEAAALLDPDQWLAAGTALIGQAEDSPLLVLICLLTVALLGCKKRMLARLERLIDQASHPPTYNFRLPLQVLLATLTEQPSSDYPGNIS
jgi:potassium efflux system protein